MITSKFSRTIKGFTLIELMVVIAIIAILAAIAIPNYISMRQKAYCTEAEKDADHIAAAIANYYGTGTRTAIPTLDNLGISIRNNANIAGIDPNVLITIQVTDRTHRCPIQYQAVTPGWDSNYMFTREIK